MISVVVQNIVRVQQWRGSRVVLDVKNSDIFLGNDTYGWPEQDYAVWSPPTPSFVVVAISQLIAVPNIIGLNVSQVAAALALVNLSGQLVGSIFSALPAGTVATQVPAADTFVNVGFTVRYQLSLGPAPPPPFSGLTEWQARAILANAGFVPYPVVQYVYSLTVPDYYMVAQSPPAGTMITSSQGVQLFVSIGPPNPVVTSTVPNVVGMKFLDAQMALVAAQCAVATVTWQINNTGGIARVLSQTPAAGGPVTEWTQVSLVVASGPAVIYPNTGALTVPNVVTP